MSSGPSIFATFGPLQEQDGRVQYSQEVAMSIETGPDGRMKEVLEGQVLVVTDDEEHFVILESTDGLLVAGAVIDGRFINKKVRVTVEEIE